MIIMMLAYCTQEVGRSALEIINDLPIGFPINNIISLLAAKATRGWFDANHLEDARVQSPGVCTQSVMSTVVIRSNLMGCQRTEHGYMK